MHHFCETCCLPFLVTPKKLYMRLGLHAQKIRVSGQDFFFLDPQPQPEGSYKIGYVCLSILSSFHPSFSLSLCFFWIGSLFFCETQHGVRDPYIVVFDRAGFFGKNSHQTKMTKDGQEWPKNKVFGFLKKITSLVLSEICVK